MSHVKRKRKSEIVHIESFLAAAVLSERITPDLLLDSVSELQDIILSPHVKQETDIKE